MQIHGFAGLGGRTLASVDKGIANRSVTFTQEEEPSAAKSGTVGLDYCQGCTEGDGCIERVATLLENFSGSGGGFGVRAGDRGTPRALGLGTDSP